MYHMIFFIAAVFFQTCSNLPKWQLILIQYILNATKKVDKNTQSNMFRPK